MKNLILAFILTLSFSALPISRAADAKTENPPSGGVTSVAGQYKGQWKGSGEGSGDLQIKLKQEGATWVAEAMFTFEQNEISTKMKSVEIDGAKVQLVFDWVIDNTPGQSKITGELKGDSLQGTFETKSRDGDSKGTWKVTKRS